VKLRELQDRTGGFQCFIPLAFHPANTPFEGHMPATDGFDDLKTIAVSRLMLDNLDHIKAYWVMLTQKIAQVALHFGADDLDGTIVDERITHAAGGVAGKGMTRMQLEAFIREAGREPVERDTLYRPVQHAAAKAAARAGDDALPPATTATNPTAAGGPDPSDPAQHEGLYA
jgi:aminodeoxyfutalosine synthase